MDIERKIKVKKERKVLNPLFELWLFEWYNAAKAHNIPYQTRLGKALYSLQRCPMQFKSGSDCFIVKHFNKTICSLLDERLKKHKERLRKSEKFKRENDNFTSSKQNSNETVKSKKGKILNVTRHIPVKRKNQVLTETDSVETSKSNNVNEILENNTNRVPEIENDYTRFILEPNSFDIILLVDVHETNSKSKAEHDLVIAALKKLNTNYQVRHLHVGDFAWIARCRKTQKELVLPFIVERKQVDDLSSSIKDTRFHEQKFRLKRSGIENIIYLVEELKPNVSTSLPAKTLFQACTNSLVQDGFSVKFTKNRKHSIQYLSIITNFLTEQYESKRLISCKKTHINSTINTEDTKYLMEFNEFNESSSKTKALKLKEMFTRQLIQIKGLSIDKALGITNEYPTPVTLVRALLESDETLLTKINVNNDKKKSVNATMSRLIHMFYTNEELK